MRRWFIKALLVMMFTVVVFGVTESVTYAKPKASKKADVKKKKNKKKVEKKKQKGKVILDNEWVKITYYGLVTQPYTESVYLNLLAENKSDRKIYVSVRDDYVNDIESGISLIMRMDIGKKSKNEGWITGYTIDEIEKLDFKFVIIDENYDDLFVSEMITIKVK